MKLFKIFLLIISISLFSWASSLKPTLSFIASGGVTDLSNDQNNIYISTQAGKIDIFSLKSKSITSSVQLPTIKDFMGDDVPPKVYCADVLNERMLIASKAQSGFSQIFRYEAGKLDKIIDTHEQKAILKALWVDENKIIFATLSNQFYLYDIENKKYIWQMQVSGSKFSDFVLNENRDQLLSADESGDLKLHSIKDGSFIKSYTGQNLDNVFQIDLKNGKIITAGQDMRTVVYDKENNSAYYKKARFLIYSAGLSPSGKKAAFAKYENNDIQVFHTEYKNDIIRLTHNKMTITKILFINENELFVASDARKVNYYNLNK